MAFGCEDYLGWGESILDLRLFGSRRLGIGPPLRGIFPSDARRPYPQIMSGRTGTSSWDGVLFRLVVGEAAPRAGMVPRWRADAQAWGLRRRPPARALGARRRGLARASGTWRRALAQASGTERRGPTQAWGPRQRLPRGRGGGGGQGHAGVGA